MPNAVDSPSTTSTPMANISTLEAGDTNKYITYDLTDYGNAERFIAQFGDIVRYAPSHGWFLFDGTRWQQVKTFQIRPLAKASLETLYEEAKALSQHDSVLSNRISAHRVRSQSLSRLSALISLACGFPGIIMAHTDFDANPHLLNMRNGTLDLRTGQLHSHQTKDYLTRLIPYDYDPLKRSSSWEKFLARLTKGDADLQNYLQRVIGSTLFGATQEGTCFLLTGPGYRAHHLLLSILHELLADYAVKSQTLQRSDLSSDLLTARLLTLVPSAFPCGCNAPLLSAFLNGDAVALGRSNTNRIVYQARATLWLSVPVIPKLPRQWSSLHGQLQPIPISLMLESEEFTSLRDQLRTELPAIMAWAVQGYQLWDLKDAEDPICLRDAAIAFREEQDELISFFNSCCTQNDALSIPSNKLYQAYVQWARTSDIPYRFSATHFHRLMKAHGFEQTHQSSKYFYRGLALIIPDGQAPTDVYSEPSLAALTNQDTNMVEKTQIVETNPELIRTESVNALKHIKPVEIFPISTGLDGSDSTKTIVRPLHSTSVNATNTIEGKKDSIGLRASKKHRSKRR